MKRRLQMWFRVVWVLLFLQYGLAFSNNQSPARVRNLYLNYYSLPRTSLGMNYYLNLFKRGGINRVSFPYDLGPRPDDATCSTFIRLLQSNGIQVVGWYHAQSAVNTPQAYFTEMFRRFPTLDGVTADDGYELFVGRIEAIKKDPALIDKGIEIGKRVYEAVKSIKPTAFISASSAELVDKAPIGIACIKNGTLDYLEPEVYHPVNSPALHKSAEVPFDRQAVINAREAMTKAWIQAVGVENASKLVMLISNYQSSYGNPAKSADIVLTEITGLQDPSPKVGAGLFSLAYLTDEQMDVLGTGKPFEAKLPAGLKRTPGRMNVLFHGRIGCYRITDMVGSASGWLDMWPGPKTAVKFSTFPLLNDELLNQVDVYVTAPPGYYGPYTPEEKQALARFISRGGRLLYLAFLAGESKSSQTMLSDFGLEVGWGAGGAKVGPLTFSKVADHPLANQVTALPWVWPSAESAEQICTTGETAPIFSARLPDGKELVEVAAWQNKASGGKIAVVASGMYRFNDGSLGIDNPANLQFAKNLIKWLCEKTP